MHCRHGPLTWLLSVQQVHEPGVTVHNDVPHEERAAGPGGGAETQQGDAGLQGDLGAGEMIMGVEGVDPARRELLINLLDVDLSWWVPPYWPGGRPPVDCMHLIPHPTAAH